MLTLDNLGRGIGTATVMNLARAEPPSYLAPDARPIACENGLVMATAQSSPGGHEGAWVRGWAAREQDSNRTT